jgi:hypothetical protein
MGILTNLVVQGGLAVGNTVATERDRPPGDQGTAVQRAKRRVRAVVGDGTAKTVVGVGAPLAAKEVARWAGAGLIGRVARGLAGKPVAAAGVAILAVDVVRDVARVVSGEMRPSQAIEHVCASATGLAGGAGGGYAGAALGTALIPVPLVGTVVGGVVGSVAGALAGDAVGRSAARKVLG